MALTRHGILLPVNLTLAAVRSESMLVAELQAIQTQAHARYVWQPMPLAATAADHLNYLNRAQGECMTSSLSWGKATDSHLDISGLLTILAPTGAHPNLSAVTMAAPFRARRKHPRAGK